MKIELKALEETFKLHPRRNFTLHELEFLLNFTKRQLDFYLNILLKAEIICCVDYQTYTLNQ